MALLLTLARLLAFLLLLVLLLTLARLLAFLLLLVLLLTLARLLALLLLLVLLLTLSRLLALLLLLVLLLTLSRLLARLLLLVLLLALLLLLVLLLALLLLTGLRIFAPDLVSQITLQTLQIVERTFQRFGLVAEYGRRGLFQLLTQLVDSLARHPFHLPCFRLETTTQQFASFFQLAIHLTLLSPPVGIVKLLRQQRLCRLGLFHRFLHLLEQLTEPFSLFLQFLLHIGSLLAWPKSSRVLPLVSPAKLLG